MFFTQKLFAGPYIIWMDAYLLDTCFSFIGELFWFSKNIKEKPSRPKNISKYTLAQKIKQEDLELRILCLNDTA